jgi:hypothetical protein
MQRLFAPWVRLLAVCLLVAGALSVTPPVEAQRNSNTVRNFIDALNSDNATTINGFLAPDFQLIFTGGATYSGAQAQQLLLDFQRPIAIKSTMPQGMQVNQVTVSFNNSVDYELTFNGARGGKIAKLTINSENP